MTKTLLSVAFGLILHVSATAQCLEGDCQNGRGLYQFENGNKYSGDFKRSTMHGKGTIVFANGNKYNGDWRDGSREGVGVYYFLTGNVYTGNFKKNKFEGKGSMSFSSGNKYLGMWENDQAHGAGVYTFASGDRYEGTFENGKFSGFGRMFYKNGEKYVGDWRNNLRHGSGKIIRADGQTTEGVWDTGKLKTAVEDETVKNNANTDLSRDNREGGTSKPNTQQNTTTTANTASSESSRDCNSTYCRDGKGAFSYGDGSRWVGEFKDGAPEGQGTCYYKNGDKYVGRFEKHAPQGEGTMFHANGRIVSAIWEYGRPVGDIPSSSKIPASAVDVDQDPEVKIWAVVVGVGRYSSMPVLKYSDDDAYQYYAFLKSPEGGALPDKQLKVLVDEDATRANILQTLRQVLLKADNNDVIMFYFSGHGLDGSFLPQDYDGINNRLLHSEVKQIFEQSKAKHKIVVADACFSGSMLAMKQPFAMQQMKSYYRAFEDTKGGTALFMSSKSQEYSLEDQGLRSGIFSHYLIRGLKGEADVDANKIVTMREIFDFVYKNVRTYTSNAQTPTISGQFDWQMPTSMVRN
jgi:hypothetical protein